MCGDATLTRAEFLERVERLAALFAGRGVTDLALAVDEVKETWNRATLAGAQTIRPPGPVSHGSGIWMAAVTGWGGFSSSYVHTLISASPDGPGDRGGPRWDAAIVTVRPGLLAAAGEFYAAACGMTCEPGEVIVRHGEPDIYTAACAAENFTLILAGSLGGPLLACRRDHGGVAAIRQLTCRTAAGGTAKIRPLHGSAFTVECTSGNPARTGPVTGYGSCPDLDDLDAPRERGTVR